MRPIATDVALSVCLSLCSLCLSLYNHELCWNKWINRDAVWDVDSHVPKKSCIMWKLVFSNSRGSFEVISPPIEWWMENWLLTTQVPLNEMKFGRKEHTTCTVMHVKSSSLAYTWGMEPQKFEIWDMYLFCRFCSDLAMLKCLVVVYYILLSLLLFYSY